MFERFASDTRRIVGYAMNEARDSGDRRLGTEHLLLGALHEPTATGVLGVTLQQAHAAAAGLDAAALQAVGLSVAGFDPASKPAPGRKPPFSSGAKAVMASMVHRAARHQAKEITTADLLLSLLEREEQDPVTALLAAMNVDRDAVRQRLAAPL